MINKKMVLQTDCQLTIQEKKVAQALLRHWQTGKEKQSLGMVARVVSQCSVTLRMKLQCADIRQAVYKAKIKRLLD